MLIRAIILSPVILASVYVSSEEAAKPRNANNVNRTRMNCDRVSRILICELLREERVLKDMFIMAQKTVTNNSKQYLDPTHMNFLKFQENIDSKRYERDQKSVQQTALKECYFSLETVGLYQKNLIDYTTNCTQLVNNKARVEIGARWSNFNRRWSNLDFYKNVVKVQKCNSTNINYTNARRSIKTCSGKNVNVRKANRLHTQLVGKKEISRAWLNGKIEAVKDRVMQCLDNDYVNDLNRVSSLGMEDIEKCVHERSELAYTPQSANLMKQTVVNDTVCDEVLRLVSCEILRKNKDLKNMFEEALETITNKAEQYFDQGYANFQKFQDDIASKKYELDQQLEQSTRAAECVSYSEHVDFYQLRVLNYTIDCCRKVNDMARRQTVERWQNFTRWWDNFEFPKDLLRLQNCSSGNNDYPNLSRSIEACSKKAEIFGMASRFDKRLIGKKEICKTWLDNKIQTVNNNLTMCTDNRYVNHLNKASLLMMGDIEKCVRIQKEYRAVT